MRLINQANSKVNSISEKGAKALGINNSVEINGGENSGEWKREYAESEKVSCLAASSRDFGSKAVSLI